MMFVKMLLQVLWRRHRTRICVVIIIIINEIDVVVENLSDIINLPYIIVV